MADARRSGAPTIRDVARLAGVSAQTVSRVLNTPARVQAETRARVETSIATLGYRRSPMARGLATNRSGAIGVLDAGSAVIGQMLLRAGIEKAARERAYSPRVFLAEVSSESALRGAFETFRDELVEGVIVLGNTTQHVRSAIMAASHMPVVLVAPHEEPGPRLSTVAVDQAGGTRSVVSHLLTHGPRVAHISGPAGWVDADARMEAWRAMVPGADALLRRGDWSAESGHRLMSDLLDVGVDAVFAGNDYMALGALKACSDRGISVPDDVAVAGFDDIPGADFLLPPLTTVRQPFSELGVEAVALLADLISGDEPRAVLLPADLVIRKSG